MTYGWSYTYHAILEPSYYPEHYVTLDLYDTLGLYATLDLYATLNLQATLNFHATLNLYATLDPHTFYADLDLTGISPPTFEYMRPPALERNCHVMPISW